MLKFCCMLVVCILGVILSRETLFKRKKEMDESMINFWCIFVVCVLAIILVAE